MQIYLVGGAVRDQLLGLPVHENDWVVVGATAEQMRSSGYQQVGKDFPVFLHPDSHEEYALARTEKKTRPGHTGFAIHADPNVTLEQDLQRRDLTINAIARGDSGNLIDPCNGINDLNQRVLRHISDAFIEDPLRVLRVARFHAKLHHLGFSIAPETLAMMKKISLSGELGHLAGERIWREFHKGLDEASPQIFIQSLYRCNALEALLPELDHSFHQSDNLRDTQEKIGQRTLTALSYAADQQLSVTVRWAIVCHALEAGAKPKNLAPRVIPKIDQKNSVVNNICKRMNTPAQHARLATLAAHYIELIIQAKTARPDTIVSLLDSCDTWRRPDQFEQLLQVAECLIATNSSTPMDKLGSITFLRQVYNICKHVDTRKYVENGLKGEEIGQAVRNARKVAIASLKHQFN